MERTIRREKPSGNLWGQTFNPSTFRACLINDDAGAKALSWLLNSANHDSVESTFGIKFIQATAFCLVGEGRTDVWWDMLKIQHAPKPTKDNTFLNEKYRAIRWYHAWLTAILEAQAFWTTEQNRFNEPLATLQKVIQFNREERTREKMIPVVGGFHWLETKLPLFDTRHINVEAWDAFVEFESTFLRHAPQEARFKGALMQLMHPVNRSADPLVACIRQAESCEGTMHYLTRMPKGLLLKIMSNLVQYCYKSGRMDDVRWTIDFDYRVQQQQEKLYGREVGEQRGWVQRRVGRKATRTEIADGVPVDAQGRLIPIGFVGSAEDVRKRVELATKQRTSDDGRPSAVWRPDG